MTQQSEPLRSQQASDKTRKWDINYPHAKHLHIRIGEMIALDCQPFSVVDDIGHV